MQQKRVFAPQEMIFKEGQMGECAYLIERGRVLIFIDKKGTEMPLRILGEGEVIGEMSLIDNTPRSASCRALSDCHLVVVTKEQLLDRITAADPVVRLLMKALLERLRSQNDVFRSRKPVVHAPMDPLIIDKREALERIGLENRIASGLEDNEFLPYYQAIFDLNTGVVIGCEALIRWHSKDQGVVSPVVFMDAMEESSLILKAGQMMIEKSMQDLPEISRHFSDPENFFVSINVSGRQFASLDFLAHLEATRQRLTIPSRQIKLELTERIMTEGPQALAMLRECRLLGYKLAIDDFGTGFSSLQYLAQMPLTDLKIDRSFVLRMKEGSKSLSIVQSLIHMARLLGMNLTAEGIEAPEQLRTLKELGVEMGQGYLFAKPIPLNEFVQLAKTHSRVA